MIIRTSLVGLVIAAAIGIAACGSDNGISQDEANKLQQQGQELQKKAQKTADDIKSGKVDAEQAAKDIEKDANKLTNDTIDAAKDSDIPDDVKKQLEDAQDQINAAGGGSSLGPPTPEAHREPVPANAGRALLRLSLIGHRSRSSDSLKSALP